MNCMYIYSLFLLQNEIHKVTLSVIKDINKQHRYCFATVYRLNVLAPDIYLLFNNIKAKNTYLQFVFNSMCLKFEIVHTILA